MREFGQPQPEQPWNEAERTLNFFKNGIDDRFRDHFEDVYRGILSHGLSPERLKLKAKDGTLFTLVRTINTDPDAPDESTFYGLHVKEKDNDYLYRIKFGMVFKLSPTPDEMRYLNLKIQSYAAGIDPEKLNDQPAAFRDVERSLKLAEEASPLSPTFQDISDTHMNTHMGIIKNEITREIYDDNDFPVDYDKEQEAKREATAAVPFFNWSIDEIMDARREDVKTEDTTELLEIIKRGDEENEVLVVTIARERDGDTFDDRRVAMVYQGKSYSTEMGFEVQSGELLSSRRIDHPAVVDGTTHVRMDPNAARDLIKFLKKPKI